MNRVESVLAARAALQLALSPGREAEKKLKEKYLGEGIRATAVDYG
ncbi:MAG: hut operon positive regulator HutP, partial [Firmicutes bacterium]|nr:hut operon positive regulator HutP [Bacillota bacterium]